MSQQPTIDAMRKDLSKLGYRSKKLPGNHYDVEGVWPNICSPHAISILWQTAQAGQLRPRKRKSLPWHAMLDGLAWCLWLVWSITQRKLL